MPNVNGKKFPYTPAGKAEAAKEAAKEDKPMEDKGGPGKGRRNPRESFMRGLKS